MSDFGRVSSGHLRAGIETDGERLFLRLPDRQANNVGAGKDLRANGPCAPVSRFRRIRVHVGKELRWIHPQIPRHTVETLRSGWAFRRADDRSVLQVLDLHERDRRRLYA